MILESCFPTEGGGGAEGQVRTLSGYLRQCGVPVTIVVPMVPHGLQREHDEVDGVPVWRIPYPRIRKLGGFVMMARFAWFLFRNRRNYEVIHAHIANNLAVMSSLAGRALGKTVIVKMTGSLELAQGILDSGTKNLALSLKRGALKRANYFQATSSEIQERLLENGFHADRVKVIPNAVDVDRFADAARNRKADAPHPRTAVYVGRLEPDKGTDVLVDAWIEAFGKREGIQLLLVGEGGQRNLLEQMISEHGREQDIRLLGPQVDVGPFLASADFAVLPSRYEGLSNALLEYMAAGLPVLGTRVSGTVDYIEQGRCGWLVDSDNKAQLVTQLRYIANLDMETLQKLGAQARHYVVARARIDNVVAQLAGLYEIESAFIKQVAGDEYV